MRIPARTSSVMGPPSPASTSSGTRDAESLFRTKKIPEIRAVEASTKLEIEQKKEELRQLVGKSYRDLIDSADTIVLMKYSTESISAYLDSISSALQSLSASASPDTPKPVPNHTGARIYGIASRVKYLVDTPESIWGCLDESMLLEASGRYLRAKEVHSFLTSGSDHRDVVSKFPLLRHQWQLVESFKGQISQRSRERLMDQGLSVGAYADALAAATTIDGLDPKQVLGLFLESRRSWISQKYSGVWNAPILDSESVTSFFCEVGGIIRSTLGQVGILFLQALNDLPLFYKTVLESPPGTQLYGGIQNPEEEVRRWKLLRENLETVTVILEPEYVAQCASSWLKGCCDEIFGVTVDGKRLIDYINSGEGLGCAEKLVQETLDDRESLDGSLEEWLKGVFGSDIESPWDQIKGLILKDGKDILEAVLEEVLVQRMKDIVLSGFQNLRGDIDIEQSICKIVADPEEIYDFEVMKAPLTSGDVWFSETNFKKAAIGYSLKPTVDDCDFGNCLNAYFGPEVRRIRDSIDSRCGLILDDLLSFMESRNSLVRLKELAPYLQEKCHQTISSILRGMDDLLSQLSVSLGSSRLDTNSQPPSVIVKRSLFIGRLILALRKHSVKIPLVLGSPRQWVKDTSTALSGSLQQSMMRHSIVEFDSLGPQSPRRHTVDIPRKYAPDSPRSPRRQFFDNPRRQTMSNAAALFPVDDNFKPKFDELSKMLRELCIKAHIIWISWASDELSAILSVELVKDDALYATTTLKGWEVTTIKQEESSEGPLEMKIALPFMPSLYISAFLFQACQEIHRIGGHVLDKLTLQNFAWNLFEKMANIYDKFLSEAEVRLPRISDKGILQIMLDLRFAADILSGGSDFKSSNLYFEDDPRKTTTLKSPFRQKQSQMHPVSASVERAMGLIHTLSRKLDPIDWAIYESYLFENEKQSYKRYAVLFGFLVQLNRMYTDTVLKLPTKANTESNILRCSTVPRFKYLPISAPALSLRGAHKSSFSMSSNAAEQTSKADFDENSGFDLETPLFKSFMTQVGSKFGESTSRLGSMLTDAQVGRFRDRSAAAMSTFGDMLPGPAAGLLSSFAAGVTRSDI